MIEKTVPNQHEMFFTSHDVVSRSNETMLDLLFGSNPITDEELQRLMELRPAVYAKYRKYLGTRK